MLSPENHPILIADRRPALRMSADEVLKWGDMGHGRYPLDPINRGENGLERSGRTTALLAICVFHDGINVSGSSPTSKR